MSVEGIAAAEVAEFEVAATALLRAAVIGVPLPVCSGISGEESATVVVRWAAASSSASVCVGGRYSTPTLSKTNVEVVLSVSRSTSTAENARASVRGGERHSPTRSADLAKGNDEIETPELKHQ